MLFNKICSQIYILYKDYNNKKISTEISIEWKLKFVNLLKKISLDRWGIMLKISLSEIKGHAILFVEHSWIFCNFEEESMIYNGKNRKKSIKMTTGFQGQIVNKKEVEHVNGEVPDSEKNPFSANKIKNREDSIKYYFL